MSYKILASAVLVWLAVPVIVFCAGYLKIIPAVIFSLVFAGVVFFAARGMDDTRFEIPVRYVIAFAVAAVLVSILMGVGEYICSLQDHSYRRAILNDLVNYKWPVIYDMSTQQNPDVINITGSSGKAAFCYYFVYWMPAAAIGKLCGGSIAAANAALLIWTSIGVFLTFTAMSVYSKKASMFSVFFYLFFGGLDLIPFIIHEINSYSDWLWLEGWVPHMSYICNFVNLGNVFHQAVPCYLICAMLLISRRPKALGLGCGILFCYSPWAVIGILPVTIAKIFDKENRKAGLKSLVKDILSPVNIISVIAILFVFVPFYMSTSGLSQEKGLTASFYDSIPKFILCYLALILLEVVPAAAIVFARRKKDIVFIVSAATLGVIPLIKISYQNDFAMRASMPALFVLAVMVYELTVRVFEQDKENNANKVKGKTSDKIKILAATLLIIAMSFPSAFEIFVVTGSTLTGDKGPQEVIGSFGNIRSAELAPNIKEQFYVEDYEDKFFFKYLA
ncbi:MAG: hypothetical protein J6X33_09855 [Clostridiales bacterium]|nr:hypothetical protein [Clostridiales bacterium]